MQYTVLVAEDEPLALRTVCSIIEKRCPNFRVIATAENGRDALDKVRELKPDLVISDIKMPLLSGVEMAEIIHRESPDICVLIISGYAEFEYAQSAIRSGVTDYLLKPIDQDQLNEVLEKTCQVLKRQKEYASAEDEIRRLSEHIELSNRRNLFCNLLEDGASFPKNAEELQLKYQKKFPFPCLQVFMLKTDRNLEDNNSLLLAQKVKEAAARVFPGEKAQEGEAALYKTCMETVHTGFAAILNFREEETERVRSRLQTLAFDVRELAGMFGIRDVTIGVGPVVRSLTDLPAAAVQAEEAEAAKVVLGGNRILDLSEYHFSRVSLEQIFGDREHRSLKNALETLNPDLYSDLLDGLYERMDTQPPIAPGVVWNLRQEIFEIFAQCAEALGNKDGWEENRSLWMRESSQASGLTMFFRTMDQYGKECISEWKKQKQNEEKLPIRLAKAWIAEHYGDAVTLEMVADQVGLSPTYFSTQFRQMEGRTFSDYLTTVRMEAARELLSTTSMTNYEIADRIGYSDEKYFGKVFKKEVGIRPGEYRKLYYRG